MNNIARVNGMGLSLGGVVNWFSSGIGAELLTAGLTLGTGYLTQQLNLGGGGSTPPVPATAPAPNQQPATQPQVITVQVPATQSAESSNNTQMIMLAGVGVLVVALFAMQKRR